jgi:hypothetical protein
MIFCYLNTGLSHPSELSVCVPKASESEKILPPNSHFKSAKA